MNKLLEAVEKVASKDKAVFKGFADHLMAKIEDDDPNELHTALGLLSYDKHGPADKNNERPPRAAYARQEVGKGLVDGVVSKAAS